MKREHEAFDRPSERLEERGGYEGHVAETSFYTQATLGPVLRGAAIVGAGLAAAALLRGAPAAQRPGNGSERFTKEERS